MSPTTDADADTAVDPVDLPPQGRYASALDIEGWIDRQTPLIAVAEAAIPACKLGEPKLRFGPKFIRRDGNTPAHLRFGAVWFNPDAVGFRVDLFGTGTRIKVFSPTRVITIDCSIPSPVELAKDLWLALKVAGVSLTDKLPVVRDGTRSWTLHRLGCSLHVTAPGRVACAC